VRHFLGLGLDEAAPDHSTISRTRRLIDVEAHQAVFTWVRVSVHRDHSDRSIVITRIGPS